MLTKLLFVVYNKRVNKESSEDRKCLRA